MKRDFTQALKLLTVIISAAFMCSCAGSQGVPGEWLEEKAVRWTGTIRGSNSITGDIEFDLIPPKTGKTYKVSGIVKTSGTRSQIGDFRCEMEMEGTVVDGVLKATVSGYCKTSDRGTPINGSLRGTLMEHEGFGTFGFYSRGGFDSRDWQAKPAASQ